MSKEFNRAPYEFPKSVRRQVWKEQRGRSVETGKKLVNAELHHILPIAIAVGFWKDINPGILNQRENAVFLTPQEHKQVHEEIQSWPKEFFRSVVVGLYSHLRDTYRENHETVIYAATGD